MNLEVTAQGASETRCPHSVLQLGRKPSLQPDNFSKVS